MPWLNSIYASSNSMERGEYIKYFPLNFLSLRRKEIILKKAIILKSPDAFIKARAMLHQHHAATDLLKMLFWLPRVCISGRNDKGSSSSKRCNDLQGSLGHTHTCSPRSTRVERAFISDSTCQRCSMCHIPTTISVTLAEATQHWCRAAFCCHFRCQEEHEYDRQQTAA